MALVLVASVSIVLAPGSTPPAGAVSVIPTQWVAKQFTELTGRAPSQTEWTTWTTYYETNGCDADTLQRRAKGSSSDQSSPAAILKLRRGAWIISMIRAVFNHEPNDNDWSSFYTPYNQGDKTWEQTVD